MTVQNVPRVTEMSAGEVAGACDAQCMDGTLDRSPHFPKAIVAPTGGCTMRSRDVTNVAQSTLPEHQLRTRFRHVYAGRRYAAPGRSSAQLGTSKVFSCVTSRYRTDLLRRLKEARSVDLTDQGGSPDARRAGDWLGSRGILARSAQVGTVCGQRNLEHNGLNVERSNRHGLAPADRNRALIRHTVEFTKATDGQHQHDSPRHDETPTAANTPVTYARISSAAAAETVCSCPAACRGHDDDHATDRPYTGRSHPARLRMKLSSRLSHEAQCAINETRRDMGVSQVGSDSMSDDKAKETSASTDSVTTAGHRQTDVTAPVEDAVSQHYCITSRQAQGKDSIYKIRLGKQPAYMSTACPRDTDNTHAGTHVAKHAGTHVNTSNGKLLTLDCGHPALMSLAVEGATPSFNVFSSGQGIAMYNSNDRGARLVSLSQCYRTVPLLRKAREQTFEITPPWYDSRYTDYPAQAPVHTPVEMPKDIKAQAVQKCRDWLNKYL